MLALGKGLNDLFRITDIENNDKETEVISININKIIPNEEQVRNSFEKESLEELATSIMKYGIIQPIIVRKENDLYMIIAGERRFRAAIIAELREIPVIIRSYEKTTDLEVSLVENIHRSNLNPIEEAIAYKKIINYYNITQKELAKKLGKSRTSITNTLRLLQLDDRVKKFVIDSLISVGHAKILLSITDNNLQFEIANKVIKECFSVKDLENYLENNIQKEEEKPERKALTKKDYLYKAVENNLNKIFGTKVKIKDGKYKGKIEIEYYSEEDLKRILTLINKVRK